MISVTPWRTIPPNPSRKIPQISPSRRKGRSRHILSSIRRIKRLVARLREAYRTANELNTAYARLSGISIQEKSVSPVIPQRSQSPLQNPSIDLPTRFVPIDDELESCQLKLNSTGWNILKHWHSRQSSLPLINFRRLSWLKKPVAF